MAELVVYARLPAVQDVHRQVLQTLGDELYSIRFLFAGLPQSVPKRGNRVVKGPGIVRAVLEHDQVGSQLIEVPAPAAAAHIGLNATLEKRVELLALLATQRRDAGHIRMSEKGPGLIGVNPDHGVSSFARIVYDRI